MRVQLQLLFLCLVVGSVSAQTHSLAEKDAIRLTEAYALSNYVGDSIWEGWSDVPFAILLLTPERDFLIGHPQPSDDFISEGVNHHLGLEVFSRPRTEGWSLQLLATFPAVGGLPTVVIGQAEATGKSSTQWVLTLLHEHFHQLQMGWELYYSRVDALDLAGGDESGMWMLNYDFPYSDPAVTRRINDLRDAAIIALESTSGLAQIKKSLGDLESVISAEDFRYFSFQLWQEGVARYTEEMVATVASGDFRSSNEFLGLDDFITYKQAAGEIVAQRILEMRFLDVEKQGRVVFYPLGATLAVVLDEMSSTWRTQYFTSALDLVSLVSGQ